MVTSSDAVFIDRLRGGSILRVILSHLGLSWFYPPWSEFVLALLPILFVASGAVSLPSYHRARSNSAFLIRRLVMLTLPYYLLVLIIFCTLTVIQMSWPNEFGAPDLIAWLVIDPPTQKIDFSFGHVWFLQSLAIITVIAPPAFALASRRHDVLLIMALVSITLGAGQTIYSIAPFFYFSEINLYQPIVNMGFFFFGAWYILASSGQRMVTLIVSGSLSVIGVAVSLTKESMELGIAAHSYAPDLYYLSVSYLLLSVILSLQRAITLILDKSRKIDWFVRFFSRHAFSAFLLHVFFIYWSEVYLGLENVAGSPFQALIKIGFVILATMLAVVPFTTLSRSTRQTLLSRLGMRAQSVAAY